MANKITTYKPEHHVSFLLLPPTAPPGDYTGILDRALTFSPQLPSMTVLVPIEDDLIDEEDLERFTVSLILVTDNALVLIALPQVEVNHRRQRW